MTDGLTYDGNPGSQTGNPISGWRRLNKEAAKRYGIDLAERVIWTFVQAFGSTLVLSNAFEIPGLANLTAWQTAGLAGGAAVLSLVKGLVAKFIGDGSSASTAPQVGVLPVTVAEAAFKR